MRNMDRMFNKREKDQLMINCLKIIFAK